MSRPTIGINNFLRDKSDDKNKNIKIDFVSKFYIIFEFLLGLNRISVISTKRIYYSVLNFYSVIIITAFVYVNSVSYKSKYSYLIIVDLVSVLICVPVYRLTSKKLFKFYQTLNEFDDKIGYNERTSKKILYTPALLILNITLTLIFFYLGAPSFEPLSTFNMLMVTLVHSVELHYQGHLLYLLIQRVNLMKKYYKFSFPINKKHDDVEVNSISNKNYIKEGRKKSYIEMHMRPDFYKKMIIVYNNLYEAIKWQVHNIILYFTKNIY